MIWTHCIKLESIRFVGGVRRMCKNKKLGVIPYFGAETKDSRGHLDR